jgi:DNA-binding NarL/FixJ family response regulator
MTVSDLRQHRALVPTLRVVLADNQPAARTGLRVLLSETAGFTVEAESGAGAELVEEALRCHPDVLVVDPGPDGFRAIARLRREDPGIAVLVFTSAGDDESVFAAIRAGARGYLLKDAGREDIIRTVRGVAAGEAIFCPRVAARLTVLLAGAAGYPVHPFPHLTGREREVLDLIAAGLGNAAIAARLQLAQKTVSNNISAIFSKLQVADRAEAIARARNAGLGRPAVRVPAS